MKQQNKHILLINNGTSGLYSLRREVLEALCSRYQLSVVAKKNGNTEKLSAIGCQLFHVEMDYHGKNPLQEFRLVTEYKRIMNEIRPDVVLTYTIKPNIYGGLAAASLGIPQIANITGLGDAIENPGILSQFTRRLYRYGLKKAKKVFFQNQSNCDFFISHGLYRGPYEVLPGSGVNLERHPYEPYPAERKDEPIVLSVVGRMTRDKGVREILAAAEQLKNENLIIRLIGQCQGEYLDQIRAAEADGIVRYLGYQQNPHEWYKTSHAILHASYHEGMSNVLLEAAACGRPILATNVPGCRETYDEGVSGLGFPPKNSEAIVETVRRFLALPYEEKKQMGVQGRRKVESAFDRQIIVNKYLNEIEGSLSC